MQPKIELLPPELVERVLDESFQLLMEPGVKVQTPEARRLLAGAGAHVDEAHDVVRIPEAVAR